MRSALLWFALVVTVGSVCLPAHAAPKDKDWGYRPRLDKDGWEILFDGSGLDAWDQRGNGWVITDQRELYRARKAGDLWSKRRFCDFVLDLEFKVAKGTNSGVFIRTHSRRDWLHTGIEVQVLDSAGKANPGKHDTGAVYDIKAPMKNAMKPPGEWNRYVITVDENMITVQLNGEKVNEVDLDLWTEAHKNPDGSRNKFRDPYKEMVREGFLALQDHGRPVWYRNIKIKRLGDRLPMFTGNEHYRDIRDRELADRPGRIRRRELARKREEDLKRKKASVPARRPAAPTRNANDARAERFFKMARQAEKMGQRGAAVTFYSRIVRDYPDTSAAKRAQDRLAALRK
jgi:hypothetical protein